MNFWCVWPMKWNILRTPNKIDPLMISIISTKINDAVARATFRLKFRFHVCYTSATRDNLMACFGWFSFLLNDNFSAERWPWLCIVQQTDELAEDRHQNVTTRITESQWHDWRIFRRYTHRPTKWETFTSFSVDSTKGNLIYIYIYRLSRYIIEITANGITDAISVV